MKSDSTSKFFSKIIFFPFKKARIIATCTSSIELVGHLNQTLLEHCGLNNLEARTPQVNELTLKFTQLLQKAREREKQLREAR